MKTSIHIPALTVLFAFTTLNAQLYWDFDPPADSYTGEAINLKDILGQGPIGEDDRLVVEGNNFVNLATGEPVRFWGVNINSNSNTSAAAAYYAKRGVNAARYHSSKALVDSNSSGYLQISPSRLDNLHKAVANYSEEGIYLFLSETFFPLSFSINPLWGIDGYDQAYIDSGGNTRAYFILWFDEDLKSAYKDWLRQMLVAENPYNGLRIADDPGVANIELVNEDNLFFWSFSPDRVPVAQWRKVEAAMYDFVVTKYGSIETARSAWGTLSTRFNNDNPEAGRLHVIPAGGTNLASIKSFTPADRRRVADQMEFLATTQRNWFGEMTQVLRDNGYQGGVIATNWKTSDSDSPTSVSYLQDIEYWTYTAAGVLDNHHYFSAIKGVSASNGSVAPGDKYYAPPAVLEPRRLSVAVKQAEGYPSIVSELAWVAPNEYRSEASLIVGAYSGLNGLDGMFWFASEGESWLSGAGMGRWPLNIPSKVGLFPAAALMYRRGDVAESPVLVREGKTTGSLYAGEPSLIKSIQGWDVSRDGSDFNFNPETGEGAIDSLAILAGRADIAYDTDEDFVHPDLSALYSEDGKFVESFTGQLHTDFGEGLLTVDTPLTQAMAGFTGQAGTVTLSDVRLRLSNDFGSLAVVSLDGQPIAQSSRLLVQAGTRDRPTGWATTSWFTNVGSQNVEGREVLTVGIAPWQVQEADGRVIFSTTDRAVTRAVSLDENLRSKTALRTVAGASGITLTLPKDTLYTLIELEAPANHTPVITSRACPNGFIDQPYRTRLRAIGGDGELAWSSTSLPSGLSLSADGMLSGTPRSSGNLSIEVTVSDGNGDIDTRILPLFVIDFGGANTNPWIDIPGVDGWKLTAVGLLHDSPYPFVYHLDHGWLYIVPAGQGGVYAYGYEGTGWLYLAEESYPTAFYSYQLARYVLYSE